MPDVMRLTAFVLLILASGCEAKPGAGFFAVAGLAIPGVGGMAPGGDGVPALPTEWHMPRMPDVPLGMMPGGDGVAPADVIPRTIFDGLGLSIDEHLVWAQPLLLASIAFEGLLGSSCSSWLPPSPPNQILNLSLRFLPMMFHVLMELLLVS